MEKHLNSSIFFEDDEFCLLYSWMFYIFFLGEGKGGGVKVVLLTRRSFDLAAELAAATGGAMDGRRSSEIADMSNEKKPGCLGYRGD